MKKPNFFIIGAPKCGTTSMAAWLGTHPQVFITNPKEPHYFSLDENNFGMPGKREEYEALFNFVGNGRLVLGEASTWYLYSKVAISRILDYQPDAKFLAMIRNPAEMVYSLHDHLFCGGIENIKDFKTAWLLQEKRLLRLDAAHGYPAEIQYGSACRIGSQLMFLYGLVPAEKICVVVFDDLVSNPRKQYQKVLNFLGLPDDGKESFPVFNPAKENKSYWMFQFINFLNEVKKKLAIKKSLGVVGALSKLNTRIRPRPSLSLEMRQVLAEYFKEDVLILQNLLGRRFEDWLPRN